MVSTRGAHQAQAAHSSSPTSNKVTKPRAHAAAVHASNPVRSEEEMFAASILANMQSGSSDVSSAVSRASEASELSNSSGSKVARSSGEQTSQTSQTSQSSEVSGSSGEQGQPKRKRKAPSKPARRAECSQGGTPWTRNQEHDLLVFYLSSKGRPGRYDDATRYLGRDNQACRVRVHKLHKSDRAFYNEVAAEVASGRARFLTSPLSATNRLGQQWAFPGAAAAPNSTAPAGPRPAPVNTPATTPDTAEDGVAAHADQARSPIPQPAPGPIPSAALPPCHPASHPLTPPPSLPTPTHPLSAPIYPPSPSHHYSHSQLPVYHPPISPNSSQGSPSHRRPDQALPRVRVPPGATSGQPDRDLVALGLLRCSVASDQGWAVNSAYFPPSPSSQTGLEREGREEERETIIQRAQQRQEYLERDDAGLAREMRQEQQQQRRRRLQWEVAREEAGGLQQLTTEGEFAARIRMDRDVRRQSWRGTYLVNQYKFWCELKVAGHVQDAEFVQENMKIYGPFPWDRVA